MTAQVVGLFDTPIVVDELPNAAAVNAALKPLILSRRAEGPGVSISNIGGWQSEHDVAAWGGEPLMTMPNLRLRSASGTVHEPQLKMKVRSGRIIMFPSWLSHGVMPHRGSRERISIAINLLAVPINPA